MKLILFLLLLLISVINCTGTYYGIDGPDVISRTEAVNKINRALMIKFGTCGFDSKNVALLVRNTTQSKRKVLDGAYYSTRDVDFCVKSIYFKSCKDDAATFVCNISPKDFFGGGGLFQGGF